MNEEERKVIRERIQVITSGQPEYPALLKEIKHYPKSLYCIGQVKLLKETCAAVVGSRTTTAYGRNTAVSIGRCLADHGVTVVSGMAAGIDTCAHKGSLASGGNTIAVLGSGPDICYPAANQNLKAAIEERGLVMSEYAPGTPAIAGHFPQRNRIISGLSQVVIVVQARVRSGALITAELAGEQGREICAVPGNIDSQYHLGTNQLIRDGATAITTVNEVLIPLGLGKGGSREAASRLGKAEMDIYKLIQKHGELTADEICMKLSCQPSYALPILTSLEMKGFITSEIGKFFLANL